MPSSWEGMDCDLVPDGAQALAFLSWWFEKTTQGVLEICWYKKWGELNQAAQFERDDLDALISVAVQENLVPGQSMYFRAATVAPWTAKSATTGDVDVKQAPGIWSDMDDVADVERARTIQTLIRPNTSVITGTVPNMRVQSWFRTSEPIASPDFVKILNRRLFRLYGGDPSVVNPSRMMRLPGMIAWPRKEGRIPEIVSLVRPRAEDNRPSSYPLSTLASQLPAEDVPSPETKVIPASPFAAGISTVSAYLAAIHSGKGWHNAMIRLVAHWVGRGWSTYEILGHCADWTLPGYTARQTQDEVRKAIDGARSKWGVADVDQVVEADPSKPFGDSIFDPWGEPVPPDFQTRLLPGILQRYVERRARIMGTDPCALAWSALSACSAAIDGRIRLKMKKHDDWRVPPSLWVALIGRSSSKKTPIISDTWRPLESLQQVALAAYAEQVSRWNKLSKEEKADTEPPPKPKRLISNDATMESLQDILSNQDRGIAMLRDELSGFISAMDKYSGGGKGGSDRAFFLQAWNGGPHVVDRVGRGTIPVNNLLITICGGIQPEKLATFHDLTDDGLWQRFIPIIVRPGELGTDEPAGTEEQDFILRLQGLVDISGNQIANLSDAAHEVRRQFEMDLHLIEKREPLGSRFASFSGKLAGLFGRLCLVLSYVEPQGLGYIVSKKTAEQARDLILKCVVPHAAQVYLAMGDGTAPVETIQAIAAHILTKKPMRIVVSDLTSGLRSCRNRTVAEIGRMLSPLIAGGWLLPETEMPGNRAWLVNPNVHVLFSNRAEEERARREMSKGLVAQKDWK